MKIFKLSFAAIIGIAALSLTVASYAGAFNSKLAKAQLQNGCYRTITVDDCQDPTKDEVIYTASPAELGPNCTSDGSTAITSSGTPAQNTTLSVIQNCTVTAGTLRLASSTSCEEATAFCCFNVVGDVIESVCYGEHPNL